MITSSCQTPRRNHGAFTLVELLTVMAIISVLVSLSLLAFNKTVDAGKVTMASDIVSNAIRQARETALNSSRRTAVVIRTDGAHPYARLAVYSASTTLTDPWSQASAWVNLPDGVVLDNTYVPTNASSLAVTSSLLTSPPGVMDNGTALASGDYLQIVFGADGMMQTGNTNTQLKVVPGSYTGGVLVIKGPNPPVNWRSMVVTVPFGRIKEITP